MCFTNACASLPKPRSATTSDRAFFERFLAQLSERLSAPSPDLPSIRCIGRTTLKRILVQIRDQLAIPGYRQLPARELIEHLKGSGLLEPIRVMEAGTQEVSERFYAVGLGVSAASVDPLELLMALEPRGVVCYFSALRFHGLTTQVPSHHHIAVLTDWGSRSTSAATGVLSASSARPFNPLGTERFTYQETPYYTTARDRVLVPGVQTRYLGERSLVRVTTLEQTLLDTLHRPLSSGGPAVVNEAWDTALDSLDESRLVKYLEQVDDPALERRIGFLLEARGYGPAGRLAARLTEIAGRVADGSLRDAIPLFQGYPGTCTDPAWRVEFP